MLNYFVFFFQNDLSHDKITQKKKVVHGLITLASQSFQIPLFPEVDSIHV